MGLCVAEFNFPSVAADGFRPADDFFEKQVRPILAEHCWACHSAKKQESDLRLDSRAAILAGGASGEAAAEPGKPDSSLIIQAVRGTGDFAMPPDDAKPLAPAQVAALTRWVQLELPWPDNLAEGAEPRSTLAGRLRTDRKRHWAFQPIQPPPIPQSSSDWPQQSVDLFVLDKLEGAQLSPSPAADRRTLIRRATFDLWGIPPTPTAVTEFVNNKDSDAYLRLIERLLASPRYGVRWGRHWLDVARYADTRGYAFARDRRFPYSYTYRDYVVDAFNKDLPFDQFIMEQLAADLLPHEANSHSLAGLGFLTVGRRFNNRHDDIDEQIDAVTRGLMGLTVACARCHDHKYDAIPTEDYYSLYGVFSNIHEPDELPLLGDAEKVADFQEHQAELKRRQQALDAFTNDQHRLILDHARSRVGDYLVKVVSSPPEELLDKGIGLSLNPEELRPHITRAWRDYLKRTATSDHPSLMPWRALSELSTREFSQRSSELLNLWRSLPLEKVNPVVIEALAAQPLGNMEDVARVYGDLFEDIYREYKELGGNEKSIRRIATNRRQLALILFDDKSPTAVKRGELRRYLSRENAGKYTQLQKQIDAHQATAPDTLPRAMVVADNTRLAEPHVLIRGNAGRRGKQVPRRFLALLSSDDRPSFQQGSGRLELARAIASPDNPLTARVIVNRVWMHHFGQPLVDTPSDFGVRSEPPLHVELLNHMAARFLANGWSIKDLHRDIMLSSTYQQRSDDRAAARTADPENLRYWRMNRRRLEFEALRDSLLAVAGRLDETMGGRSVDIQAASATRRSVYGVVDRQDLPNLLRVFDFASPDQSIARRPQTTVPQQALFLLNSRFIAQQAEALTKNLDQSETNERLIKLYFNILQREPTTMELSIGRQFVTASPPTPDRWPQFAQLLLMTNEFCFID